MKSILLSFGPLHIYSYGLMIALGILFSIYGMERALKTEPLGDKNFIQGMVFWSVLGGFGGARLYYVLKYWDVYSQAPLQIFAIWEGGLIFYGGLLTAVLALALFFRSKKIAFLRGLDFISPYVALTHGFGRIGCFLNGCCNGKTCAFPWAVSFPEGPFGVHPVQLYEAAWLFLLVWILIRQFSNRKYEGQVFSTYLLGYGLGRLVMEFFRDENIVLMGLTRNQWISVGVILLGIIIKVWRRSQTKAQS